MDDAETLIQKNAQLVIDQLGPLSDVPFGLNRESVAWVEGFIERQRARPDLDEEAMDRLVNVLGSFLGECIIANAGGSWRLENDDAWSVAFEGKRRAFPFNKVRKLFANGLAGGDSIVSFYDIAVDYLAKGKLDQREEPCSSTNNGRNAKGVSHTTPPKIR